MADQTPLKGHNGLAEPPAQKIRRNVSGFAQDVSSLADLQWKLLSLDLKEMLQRAKPSLLLVGIGAALLLAAVPVALLGIGRLLIEYTELTLGWAYVLTAVVTMIIAAILGGVAYGRLKGSFDTLNRSRIELQSNLNWIKSALQSRGAAESHSPPP